MNKLVIFYYGDCLAVTNEQNYNSRIWNERKITNCGAFDNPQQIIDYYIDYFNCTENDFIIDI